MMDIALTSDSSATCFNLHAPGSAPGDRALAMGKMTGPMVPEMKRFSGTLPASGIHSASAFLHRDAARAGETSQFAPDMSATGTRGDAEQDDVAEGLVGMSDDWRVQADGGLRLRAAPSTGASVLIALPSGLRLRNPGCRMAGGRRWCKVATPGSALTGRAAGDCLFEDGGEAITQLPDMMPVQQRREDALVPGTAFNATGEVACTRAADAAGVMCDAGVTIMAAGNGRMSIFWPEGGSRVIRYADFTPVGIKGGGEGLTASAIGDDFVVVGGAERFVIPSAAMTGG